MSEKIYFDAVYEMKKYSNGNLETEIKDNILGLNSEEKADYLIGLCCYFIKNFNDFKVCLAIVFNYLPSKFNYNNDYELTVFIISAYAKGLISEKEFKQKIFY